MNERIYFNLLFSYYQELLTEKEKEIFSLHYEDDLSMREIANLKNISKSAVGYKIKIVEKKLQEYEDKLKINKLMEKIKKIRELNNLEEIKEQLHKLME